MAEVAAPSVAPGGWSGRDSHLCAPVSASLKWGPPCEVIATMK